MAMALDQNVRDKDIDTGAPLCVAAAVSHCVMFGCCLAVYNCAYAFPGVLVAVGVAKWPTLKELYTRLARDLQVRLCTRGSSVLGR